MILLGSLVSCADEENPTQTLDAVDDEEALEQFVSRYREGYYGEAFYSYDDLSVYFTLAPYEGVHHPDDPMISGVVSDQEVEDYIHQVYLSYVVKDDQYETLTEGTVNLYDVVTLSYRGIIDGEEKEDATAEDQTLLIGSHTFISGFEEGLVGAKIGEEIRLDLKFSPYYGTKEYAGKDVSFFVTVKQVRRPTFPEISAETFNQIYSTSFENMEQIRWALKENMNQNQSNLAYSNLTTYLERVLIENSTINSYPERETAHYRDHYIAYYEQFLTEGTSWESFCQEELGIRYEDFIVQAEQYAKDSVAVDLLLRSVAGEENISCSDEQMKSLIRGLYENQTDAYANMETFLSEYIRIYGAGYFENTVIRASALEHVAQNAILDQEQ